MFLCLLSRLSRLLAPFLTVTSRQMLFAFHRLALLRFVAFYFYMKKVRPCVCVCV